MIKIETKVINEIVNRITNVISPEAIILFGSHARDDAQEGSDLDLLVIADAPGPRHTRSVPIYRALSDIPIAMDILVYNRDEVEEWSNVRQAFVTTAVREGKVIYEKQG